MLKYQVKHKKHMYCLVKLYIFQQPKPCEYYIQRMAVFCISIRFHDNAFGNYEWTFN